MIVYVNGQTSAFVNYKLGVRQGECLSLFLFAMYVNDMEEELPRSNTGMTLDDINTLRPWQNCRHFGDDIFQCVY